MHNIIENLLYILGLTLVRYFAIAGTAFVFTYYFLSKALVNSKIQSRMLKKKAIIREILHSSQSALIFSIITILILYTPLQQYTLVYHDIDDYPLWWIIISVALSLVIHDTYFYWMHRLLHHKKIYRHTHVIHHKSTNPSPWSSYSFHVLEAIPEGLILLVLVFILPLHIISISLFTVVGLMINVYGHLGYEIAPKSFRKTKLFNILNTSVHHNMHHSRFIGNYGLYFRFWDKMMKTEIPDYENQYDLIQSKRFSKE